MYAFGSYAARPFREARGSSHDIRVKAKRWRLPSHRRPRAREHGDAARPCVTARGAARHSSAFAVRGFPVNRTLVTMDKTDLYK